MGGNSASKKAVLRLNYTWKKKDEKPPKAGYENDIKADDVTTIGESTNAHDCDDVNSGIAKALANLASVELSRRMTQKTPLSPMLLKRPPRPSNAILSPRPTPESGLILGPATADAMINPDSALPEFRRPANPPARVNQQVSQLLLLMIASNRPISCASLIAHERNFATCKILPKI